ncbi:MAG: hypothetical protein NVS3B26_30740 [Mycobacteriales bacterium]
MPTSALAVLAALTETRRADIVRLLEIGYRTQRELGDRLEMSQPLVSHHLRVLAEAGLVTSTICERVRVYMLRPETLDELCQRLAVMAEHAHEIATVRPC